MANANVLHLTATPQCAYSWQRARFTQQRSSAVSSPSACRLQAPLAQICHATGRCMRLAALLDDRKRDITVSGGEKAATPRDMTAIDMQSTALVSIKCAAQLPALPRCWLTLPSLSASCIRLGHDRAASADASQTCARPAAFCAMPAECHCSLTANRCEYQASGRGSPNEIGWRRQL